MLASDGSVEMLGARSYFLQEKYDGTRAILFKDGKKIHMIGRSWKNDFAPKFPEIVEEAKKLRARTCILDGELTFFKGKTDFFLTALAKPEVKKDYIAKLMVFDVIEIEGRSTKELPYHERLHKLKKLIPTQLKHIEFAPTHTDEKKYLSIFNRITTDARQAEGVMLKKSDAPYVEGSRDYMYKVKKTQTADCIVVGMTVGQGVRAPTFGALILGQYDNSGTLVYVGKTSGFDQATQHKLYEKLVDMPEGRRLFERKLDAKKWVPPRLCVEVKFLERTEYDVLRFPAFVRIRDDKKPRDCKI